MLEYVLLVALVAAASTGALVYLGRGSASPSHLVQQAAVELGGRGGSAVSTGSEWCSSAATGCSDQLSAGNNQTIDFWASGGLSPYSYSLSNAPSFVSLRDLDAAGGKGEAVVEPSCSDVGTYNHISIVVQDSSTPPSKGTLTFSLTVATGSC
jgi:hypothetical protein